jgi:hypothetical protein
MDARAASEAELSSASLAHSVYEAAVRNGTTLSSKADEFPQYVPSSGNLLPGTWWLQPAHFYSFFSVLKTLSGVDIQRKSTVRKGKFLFSLPGNLASVKGGKIGEISGMDTTNPVIHMDFPHVSEEKLLAQQLTVILCGHRVALDCKEL